MKKKLGLNKKKFFPVSMPSVTRKDIISVNKALKDKHKSSNFEKFMYSKDLPEVDLLIRTGGFKRISNFII